MADTQDYSFIEKYARHGQEHHSSHQVFHAYHDSARASMLEFAKSVVGSLSYERAKRLVNLHKLADIEKEAARKERSAERSASSHASGRPSEDEAEEANEKMQLSLLEEVEDEGEGQAAFRALWLQPAARHLSTLCQVQRPSGTAGAGAGAAAASSKRLGHADAHPLKLLHVTSLVHLACASARLA